MCFPFLYNLLTTCSVLFILSKIANTQITSELLFVINELTLSEAEALINQSGLNAIFSWIKFFKGRGVRCEVYLCNALEKTDPAVDFEERKREKDRNHLQPRHSKCYLATSTAFLWKKTLFICLLCQLSVILLRSNLKNCIFLCGLFPRLVRLFSSTYHHRTCVNSLGRVCAVVYNNVSWAARASSHGNRANLNYKSHQDVNHWARKFMYFPCASSPREIYAIYWNSIPLKIEEKSVGTMEN